MSAPNQAPPQADGLRVVPFTNAEGVQVNCIEKKLPSGSTLWKFRDGQGRTIDVWDKASRDHAVAAIETGAVLPGEVKTKQRGEYTDYSWTHPEVAAKRGARGGGGPSSKAVIVAAIYDRLLEASCRVWESGQIKAANGDRPPLGTFIGKDARPMIKTLAAGLLADAMELAS